MSWNYRVVRRAGELAIYSAYYDHDGRVHSISAEPAKLNGDDLDDLREELERFRGALDREVLDFESFDKN